MLRFWALFFSKNSKKVIQLYYVGIGILLLNSIFKDVSNALPMPSDIRNRIVGARMIKDGLSPYFNTYQLNAKAAYYEMFTSPNAIVTPATATPFFHTILWPIANLPQFQIDILWMFLSYLLLGTCLLLAILLVPNKQREKVKPIAISLCVAFTYSFGWRMHVYGGQNYLFVPLLVFAGLYAIKRGNIWYNLIAFAVFSASLILIRPIACLFFLPLLFFPKKYFMWGTGTLIALATYCVFVFSNPVQKTNWVDYFKAISTNINMHQGLQSGFISNGPINIHSNVQYFEGIAIQSGINQNAVNTMVTYGECSNLFIFYNKFTGKKLSVNAMTNIGIIAIVILLLPLAYFIKKRRPISVVDLFILGFVVYEAFSFCTPITRGNYCWVEFLFPLLLIAAIPTKYFSVPILLATIGLLLNIFTPMWLPARQNIGMLLILAALTWRVYQPIIVTFFAKQKATAI